MTAASDTDLHSVNLEQRLYVKKCGGGYSCLGFDVAYQWACDVASWLASEGATVDPPNPSLIGTAEGYADHCRVMDAGSEYNRRTGRRCFAHLDPELKGKEGQRVEVIDRDGERRRFYVGRSGGWLPIHLEIKTRRSSGGMGTYGTPFRSVRVVSQR
jgi:hypothetical protein